MGILNDVKEQLGVVAEDTAFDNVIIIHINSVMSILTQLGVGPAEGFMITSDAEDWDLLYADARLNAIKSYVYLRVKFLFDPQSFGSGFVLSALERQFQEMEWRLNAEVDF
jgi:hypothetical protein